MENQLILDCETTGLSAANDEILQLSIIDVDGNVLFDELIKPKKVIQWPGAEAIHGISPKDVRDCPTFDFYSEKVQSIIDQAQLIIGYNVSFDLGFLEAAGINVNGDKYITDMMKEFAEIYGEWNDFFQDFTWQKLTTMADFYNYEWDGKAHNSLADCFATLHCYKKMLHSGSIEKKKWRISPEEILRKQELYYHQSENTKDVFTNKFDLLEEKSELISTFEKTEYKLFDKYRSNIEERLLNTEGEFIRNFVDLYQDEDFDCYEINYAVEEEFRDALNILESEIEETIINGSFNGWRRDPETLESLMLMLREYKFLRGIVGSAADERSEEEFYQYYNDLAEQIQEIIEKKIDLQNEKSVDTVSEAEDELPF